jgi:hypothetical protein
MTRFMTALALALLASVIPVMQAHQIARASGGSSSAQTVAVYRQSCSATGAGAVVGTARFSPDDQGGVPGGLEIRTGLTGGLPRTSYNVYLLASPCGVIAGVGVLTTDDSGRGDLDVHVAASLVPAGSAVRVQLVAPADVLTSDSVWTS